MVSRLWRRGKFVCYQSYFLTRISTDQVSAFHHPSPATRGLLNAIMSVGSILALPITPYIADIFGRRVGVITGCLIMIVGVVIQSAAVNIGMFIAARFLIGFGV